MSQRTCHVLLSRIARDVSVAIWEMLLNITDEGFSVSISMQRFAMQRSLLVTHLVKLLVLFFITCYIIVENIAMLFYF